MSIESFRGKTVILNLWAPWCVPCLEEMPSLDRLAARLPEKDFAVVAVTKDPVGPSPSKAMFDRMALKRLRLYLDPDGKLGPEVGARGFPTTLILGAERRAARLPGGRGGLGQRRHDRAGSTSSPSGRGRIEAESGTTIEVPPRPAGYDIHTS